MADGTNTDWMGRPIGRRALLAGAGAAGLLAVTGCSLGRASSPDRPGDEANGWGGELVDPGIEKPDVTFTDMDGRPFPFREATEGKLAILFFGYTSCPDVCPSSLNGLARAIEAIGDGPGSAPMVLFVGVDTKRDTPEQLRQTIGRINPVFTGLTGTPELIEDANAQVFNPPFTIGEPDADGEYVVDHSARMFAFSPDGLAHRIYSAREVRQEQWVHDLPRLDEGTYR